MIRPSSSRRRRKTRRQSPRRWTWPRATGASSQRFLPELRYQKYQAWLQSGSVTYPAAFFERYADDSTIGAGASPVVTQQACYAKFGDHSPEGVPPRSLGTRGTPSVTTPNLAIPSHASAEDEAESAQDGGLTLSPKGLGLRGTPPRG
jgi:hypothetical protein